MTTSGNPDNSTDPRRAEQIAADFARVWEQCSGSEEVQIANFLPSEHDSERALICCRLVAVDLEQRLRRGQQPLLEDYVRRWPEMRTSESAMVRLLHDDFQIRKQYAPDVTLESYQARFPEYYDQLVRRQQRTQVDTGTLNTLQAPTFPGTARPSGDDAPRAAKSTANGGSTVQTQGKYQLIEPLGRGQFGEVWRAEAPGGVEVAVKLIRFPVGHKMTQLELQSLEVMKKLRHSFLLQVQAYWIDGEELYVVMELGDETLQDLSGRYAALGERIPERKLLGYFAESAEAVDFLHSQNVLHRDLKPANILLVSGHVKVADFGIARVVSTQQTVTATTMGTPLYMAPEVWQGRASPRSDQYSLAMTYAELRMGRAAYSGKSYFEVMNQHLKQSPDLQLLDSSERDVVSRALAKDPKDRFSTCSDFVAALRDVLEPRVAVPAPAAPPSRRWVVALLGVVLLLVVAVGSVFWINRDRLQQLDFRPANPQVSAGQYVTLKALATGTSIDLADVELVELPSGIEARRELTGSTLQFVIRVGLRVPPAKYAVRLLGGQVDQEVYLRVLPPNVVQVDGFQLSEDLRLVEGRAYAERIYCTRGGQRIEFVLIPHTNSDDPPTFYMMKTKVTNRMFDAFVKEKSTDWTLHDASENWHQGGYAGVDRKPASEFPDHPVYGVHIEDAEEFARWLGGRLPSADQWDKAAGRGEAEHEGPFTVPFDRLNSDLVIYDRKKSGPVDVGTAIADVSVHGCIDMAGNGNEYTRTEFLSGRDAKSVGELRDSLIELKSASYWSPKPFTFDSQSESLPYESDKLGDVSFRVVIEDNRFRW